MIYIILCHGLHAGNSVAARLTIGPFQTGSGPDAPYASQRHEIFRDQTMEMLNQHCGITRDAAMLIEHFHRLISKDFVALGRVWGVRTTSGLKGANCQAGGDGVASVKSVT